MIIKGWPILISHPSIPCEIVLDYLERFLIMRVAPIFLQSLMEQLLEACEILLQRSSMLLYFGVKSLEKQSK